MFHFMDILKEKNFKFIIKPSSSTARAYFKSEFFNLSLKNCSKFKIISDIVRVNEPNPADYNIAGAKFLSELKNDLIDD